jgi:hypothetical protein
MQMDIISIYFLDMVQKCQQYLHPHILCICEVACVV